MNETAAALAQLEYLPSRDLVGERLLSFEEFDLSNWATSYNISIDLHGRAGKPSAEASGGGRERGPTVCSHELAEICQRTARSD